MTKTTDSCCRLRPARPAVSLAMDIAADIAAQEQSAEEGGNAPAVTAARQHRKDRMKALKDVDKIKLGQGGGGGYRELNTVDACSSRAYGPDHAFCKYCFSTSYIAPFVNIAPLLL